MTCTACGALLGSASTHTDDGIFCSECEPHPAAPATGERIYPLEQR